VKRAPNPGSDETDQALADQDALQGVPDDEPPNPFADPVAGPAPTVAGPAPTFDEPTPPFGSTEPDGSAKEPGKDWRSPVVVTTPPAPSPGTREARVVVRRLSPLSVLRVSLLFYLCLMLVVLCALSIVYWVLGLIGVLNSASHFLSNLGLGSARGGFRINGGWIFARALVVGLAGVVIWSLVTTLLALLYNLVADVVGGVRITIAERP
jgi:hypothetical protein